MTAPTGWPDASKPGVPPHPELDGWHIVGGDVAWWRAASEHWVTHSVLRVSKASDLAGATYGGCLYTEAEVAARAEEAAIAVSAAWRAAPEGEGVMGAEYIAEGAALLVLQEGLSAPKAVDRAVKERNGYGVPQRYVLLTPAEAAAREQAARREGMEEAALKRRGFYVASRASVPERAAMWRRLRDEGVLINASWIDEDGEGATEDFGDLWLRICREVAVSEALIFYAEEADLPLKGAYVEVGMALAFGVPVYAVLPGVNLEARSMRPIGSWLAHPLVTVTPSIAAALHAMAEEAPNA